jgi:transposase
MARFDLTDFEWSVVYPLSPRKPRGCRGSVLGVRSMGIGCAWGRPVADIPNATGPYTT